MLIEGSDTH